MATRPHEWQSLASPATTSSSHSRSSAGSGSQRSRVDPFLGGYPGAPHLRTIELPETGSPMMGFTSPGSGSGSSRSRHTSLPPEGLGLQMYGYGLPSPPISPQNSRSGSGSAAPAFHPLLRGSPSLGASIVYNAFYAPSAQTVRSLHGAEISDLGRLATTPPSPRLRVSVLLYPNGATPQRFICDIELKQPRRVSAPPSFQSNSGFTISDALASIHHALITHVDESEVRRLPANEVHNARAMYTSRRAAFPASSASFVRADFTCGCTQFAGIVQNPDNTFTLRLVPPSTTR